MINWQSKTLFTIVRFMKCLRLNNQLIMHGNFEQYVNADADEYYLGSN